MNRHVLALLVAVPLWNAPPCDAQSTERAMSVPVARELLASSDPKDQAWGLWMAGRLLMTDAAPQIERVIKGALSANQGWPRVGIGLDALIEIGAKPDLELLDQLRREYPVESLILLSRLDPAANRVLLSMMSNSSGYEWFAAANLLKARKAPGFATLLLTDVSLSAVVAVSTDGNEGVGEILGGSFGIGDKAGGPAEGYPPLTEYEFRECDGPSLSLLARGPRDVCYERARSSMGFAPALSSHHTDGPSIEQRLAYFEQEWYPVTLRAVEHVSIAWKSDAASKAALADVVQAIERRYAAAMVRLRERGWLTEEETRALAHPVIRGSIRDLRFQQ